MKTAKEQIKEMNGLMLEGARKIMELQNNIAGKDKEIEERIQFFREQVKKLEFENNKLWQKRIEDIKNEIKKAKICCVHNIGDDHQPCKYTTREVIKIINKAQNKKFEEAK